MNTNEINQNGRKSEYTKIVFPGLKTTLPSVLVGIIYTDYKKYCRALFPGIYDRLTYPNKELFFVSSENCRTLEKQKCGELVCSVGRQRIIEEARRRGSDYIYFLDIDLVPDKDSIEKLLSCNAPLVGGLVCARGNQNAIIGHFYEPSDSLNRVPIYSPDDVGVFSVGGTSGASLLVARSIFKTVDYTGYLGPATIPNRFTADDEYIQIKIKNSLGISPILNMDCQSWHLNNDLMSYQYRGKVKPFSRTDKQIDFNGEAFISN